MGDALEVRISAEKFAGTVVGWKGKYGWIKPLEEIDHEKAALRGGKLFAGLVDIIGATELEDGADVEFHIFEDDSGLGAEEIVQTSEGRHCPGAGHVGPSRLLCALSLFAWKRRFLGAKARRRG